MTRLRASFTIEAACVMAIVFTAIATVILGAYRLHDKTAGAMALQELMGRGMILMNSYNSTVQIFAIFGIMALIYFVVCFTLSQIVRAYQRRLKEARTA